MPETETHHGKRWAVTLPALFMPLAASFFYFVLFPGTWYGNSFYGGIKFFLLIWPIVATAFILRESFRRESPQRSDWFRSIVLGTVFAIGVVATKIVLMEFSPLGQVVESGGANIREKVEGLGVADHYLLFALGISIAHAGLEEFFWRWFIYGNLRRLIPVPWAIAVASAGFAAHHIVILNEFFPLPYAVFFGVCVGLGGAAWCWIYERHKTLLGPWISHMIIDLAIFGIGYRILFGI